MSGAAEFTIGAVVKCDDGECGELQRLVIDPHDETVTHLVVGPKHRDRRWHLVPVALVGSATVAEVRLICTVAQFDALDPAEETDVELGVRLDWELQRAEVRGYNRLVGGMHVHLDPDGLGGADANDVGIGLHPDRRAVNEDRIPDSDGEIASGQPVHASDGPIGHVKGLVADATDHRLRYVLLEEGHLWGEKEVAIPVTAMKFVVDDGVYLNLTKEEVGHLPPTDPTRP
jgi:hypothetical protein